MFYKWLRIKTVVSEVFDAPENVGKKRLALAHKAPDLIATFEDVVSCHGEQEFQKAADRWHSALFRWIDNEYGPRAAQLENQIDQILQGSRIHIV